MRAHTEGKHEMGKRFAIVIGVAAVGVMALGAQAHGGIADEKQKFGNAVNVKASCGDEACTARARGHLHWFTPNTCWEHWRASCEIRTPNLKPASADLGPGETTTLKLKLTKKTRRRAGKALDEGKKVLARIAADTAAEDFAKRTIRLVK
jgi:hypothetical protein